MPYVDDVLEKQRESLKENISRFDLNNPTFVKEQKLDKKIKDCSDKTGIPINQIKTELMNSPTLQSFFIKNATKQNIGEKVAAEYIKKIPDILKFKKLPNGGPNSIHLLNGGIMTKAEKEKHGFDTDTKSCDFSWTYQNQNKSNSKIKSVFTTQKFTSTKGGGGTQGTVKKEMKNWIKHANQNKKSDQIFICLVDGSFWTDKRVKELDQDCDSRKNVFVCRIDGLEKLLSSLPN